MTRGSTRRQFIQQLGAVATLPALESAPMPASSQVDSTPSPSQTVTPPYDLLLAGGRVINSATGVNALLDVAIADGKIAKIGPQIPTSQSRQTFDASGMFVTPGLIDMHGHVYDGVAEASIDPDLVGIPMGVTTIVDAGSSGATTFPGFRKYVADRAQTRVYALLNISRIGLIVSNELYIDPKLIDTVAAIRIIRERDNRNVILGIKVRINGRDEEVLHDVGVLQKAREVSDETGVPIMMHWTNDARLLAILKKGDILTHPFNPPSAGPNLLDTDGKIHSQILELKQRGIFIDLAHGTHLQWEIAEKAAKQGWFPDTISTDIHRRNVGPNGHVVDLATTMSKFLYLGLPFDQVIQRVTANPASILPFPAKIGTLEVGNMADVSVLAIERGEFILLDSLRQKRITQQRVLPVAVARGSEFVAAGSWARRA